jgi:hypothetical protein
MATIRKRILIKDIIEEKIKVRYASILPEQTGTQNMVVDAFFPNIVRRKMQGDNRGVILSKRCVAISEFIAKEMNVPQMSVEDMSAILGYRIKDIKQILTDVKAKLPDLVLLGFGGTGTNVFYWIDKLAYAANVVDIFNRITIFDDDKIDITNIFRFPMSIERSDLTIDLKSSNFYQIYKTNLAWNTNASKRKVVATAIRTTEFSTNKSVIYYGAPDIATRELIAGFGENPIQFISGTHGNDSCSLYINPPQDSQLQVESYGMINLSVFFMNQLKMTIELLKTIAYENDLTTSREIMDYSFQKSYLKNELSTTGVSRTFNFPIVENIVVQDSTDAPDAPDEADIAERLLAEKDLDEELITLEQALELHERATESARDDLAEDASVPVILPPF